MNGMVDNHAGPSTPLRSIRTRSAYFDSVEIGLAGLLTPPDSQGSPYRRRTKRGRPKSVSEADESPDRRRSQRIQARVDLPPTPESLSLSSKASSARTSTRKKTSARKLKVDKLGRNAELGSPLRSRSRGTSGPDLPLQSKAKTVVGTSETGIVEPVSKIHLIQEKLRYEPWKMLVAVTLLNKTSGRAAKPIREEIFRRWPNAAALAEASIPDLAEVLYPLGLFNQRANSLIRLSQQYIQFGWPVEALSRTPSEMQSNSPEIMDVKVFYGAGVYASDSFRIYSPLYAGRGGPEQEEKWVEKRKRAIERRTVLRRDLRVEEEAEPGVEEVAEWMSEDGHDRHEEEEEWRRVVPLDKELRRYLIWRWGLEGITYDIHRGPQIHRERDRRRLGYLLRPDRDDDA